MKKVVEMEVNTRMLKKELLVKTTDVKADCTELDEKDLTIGDKDRVVLLKKAQNREKKIPKSGCSS